MALRVAAVSNNPALIPHPTISYISPNATGWLAYTPAANRSGTAVITVTVTDGGRDGILTTTGDNGTVRRTFTPVPAAKPLATGAVAMSTIHPWQNVENVCDVNGGSNVTPSGVLSIINWRNNHDVGPCWSANLSYRP